MSLEAIGYDTKNYIEASIIAFKRHFIPSRVNDILSKEDLKISMPESLYELLSSYDCADADFEHAEFILNNSEWGSFIVLKREEIEDHIQGKLVKFVSADKFKVESFSEKKEV